MIKKKLMHLQNLLSNYGKSIIAKDEKMKLEIEQQIKTDFNVESVPEAYKIYKAERKTLKNIGK